MKRRTFLKTAASVTGTLLLPAQEALRAAVRRQNPAGGSGDRDVSKMNVLLIDIEDMTAEAIGCYGNPIVKTPNLDRFAAEAVSFQRCYCQAPMCNPSRTSFLTGLRPETTRVYTNRDPMDKLLPGGTLSLVELLKAKGIYTVNIGKLFHHSWTSEKQLGAFDRLEFCELPRNYKGTSTGYPKHLQQALNTLPRPRFRYSADPAEEQRMIELKAKRDAIWRRTKRGSKQWEHARAMFQQPMANIFGDSGLLDEQEFDGKKARMAVHILGELASQNKQFFLSVGFSRPHTPLRCPKKHLDLYKLEDIGAPAAPPEKDKDIPAVAKRFGRNYDIFNSYYDRPVTTLTACKAILAYYACVSFVDAQIGLVLRSLRQLGLEDNTIVIILSDHGFQLGEHGLWSKYTLFEQSTRVPLMVRVPGVSRPAAVCDEIVELVDLVPTLCDLLELNRPANLEGISFAPLLSQPERPWKKAAFTVCAIAGYVGRSVRTRRWRYTRWRSRKTNDVQTELYDLKTDPWEQKNLAHDPRYKVQCDRLAELLEKGWQAALPDT